MTPMNEPKEIPFAEANLDKTATAQLRNGLSCELPEGRKVEVWFVDGGLADGGLCVRIFRPDKDGNISKLVFGLSQDAAEALGAILVKQAFKRKTT
jgi:hypothetical protein